MSVRELVVLSGKGGTGKTSTAASLAVLSGRAVTVDCDVDAADLHLVLLPVIERRQPFRAGRQAVIRSEDCDACGACHSLCRFGAVTLIEGALGGGPTCRVDPALCEGCGVCVRFCPRSAIDFRERICGEWMVSRTRCGPMVHARLGIASENSGKLVSRIRREARRIAREEGRALVIADGPPGIGCSVIASVTGASCVLVVTEPTVAGEHDLGRLLQLTRHFEIPTAVCVNKWDLNPGVTERMETAAGRGGGRIVGRIRYDPAVTAAQVRRRAVVETGGGGAEDLRRLWSNLEMGD